MVIVNASKIGFGVVLSQHFGDSSILLQEVNTSREELSHQGLGAVEIEVGAEGVVQLIHLPFTQIIRTWNI